MTDFKKGDLVMVWHDREAPTDYNYSARGSIGLVVELAARDFPVSVRRVRVNFLILTGNHHEVPASFGIDYGDLKRITADDLTDDQKVLVIKAMMGENVTPLT